MTNNSHKIAVIGLGYVGLPLAFEFSKKYSTIGFDINEERVSELKSGIDNTLEIDIDTLSSTKLKFSSEIDNLKECNIYIIAVPTPINQDNSPNLKPLINATKMVGKLLCSKDIVIFESTVYPGCTEEECVPVLEEISKLKYNKDFFCGYSPERINPGDKVNTISNIVKVTSGSNKTTADIVDKLYNSIIKAGTYKAESIKVAEASKSIENAQRDLNISFVNELAIIFDRIGIDTTDVLNAASTKWNFLSYKPGLVGGHCIGVDPYYLTYKAEMEGYTPDVILSGRKLNSNMHVFICNKILKLMNQKGIAIQGSNALILGISFKENCPDIRNTKVVDLYSELKDYGINVDVADPLVSKDEAKKEYGINLLDKDIKSIYDVLIIAVPHDTFKEKIFLVILGRSDLKVLFLT